MVYCFGRVLGDESKPSSLRKETFCCARSTPGFSTSEAPKRHLNTSCSGCLLKMSLARFARNKKNSAPCCDRRRGRSTCLSLARFGRKKIMFVYQYPIRAPDYVLEENLIVASTGHARVEI